MESSEATPIRPTEPQPARKRGLQFSISTLLLMMTLAAVLLSVFQVAPGMAILLALVAASALWRTRISIMRREEQGQLFSPREKVALFITNLTLTSAVAVAVVTPVGILVNVMIILVETIDTMGSSPKLDDERLPYLWLATVVCLAAVFIVIAILKYYPGVPRAAGLGSTKQSSSAEDKSIEEGAGGESR